ncbi:glycoside hydrolase family 19 protein [Rhodopila sp.]|uniref:glycoside hydrolase family 19 protein n=1 Tax=Rhodopila sp. TaxID=2480087 RepID=UPI003D0FF1F1
MPNNLTEAATVPGLSSTAAAPAKLLPREAPPFGLQRGLVAVAPNLTAAEQAAWIDAMTGPLLKTAVTTPRRVAAFLGQCAMESGGFRDLEEDLSYSAGRLCQVWPDRFPTLGAAESCAFQPEILANRVYAGRMGNGEVASGDGWRFRGRGLIQLSGRTNYERFAAAMNLGLDDATQQAATLVGAAESAAWFWSVNHLNKLADCWSTNLVTKTINGGMTGAAERSRLCNAALHAIGRPAIGD